MFQRDLTYFEFKVNKYLVRTYGVRLLDSWAVCNRVGERHAYLYDVCTTCLHPKQYWNSVILGWITSSYESDESRSTLYFCW